MAGFIGVDAPLLGLSSAIQGATAGTMAGTTVGAAPEVTANFRLVVTPLRRRRRPG